MSYAITLTPTFQDNYDPDQGLGFRFSVSAAATGVDSNIFLYCLRPQVDPNSEAVGDFHKVCSLADFNQPVGSPTPGAWPPWFRADSLTLDCRTRSEADRVWSSVQADVRRLVSCLKRADAQASASSVTFS